MRVATLYLLLLLFTSCNDYNFNSCEIEDSSENRRILVIGIDGLQTNALEKANTPTIDGLLNSAKYTMEARIDSTLSFSGPGWASILSGVWFSKHRVEDNFFTNARFDDYPLINCLLGQENPDDRPLMLTSWDELDVELGRCTRAGRLDSDEGIKKQAVNSLKDCISSFAFVHFLEVDNKGHNFGFGPGSTKYISAIQKADDRFKDILGVVRKREEQLKEDWLIIICTDHGGITLLPEESPDMFIGKHKEYGDRPEVSRVPLIFSNSSITKEIITKEVTIVDILPTALNWLGIEIKPEWTLDGKIIELE